MTPFELIEERNNEPFTLTYTEYNDLCVAINELPSEEQSQWDDTVLNFVYKNRTFTLIPD